MEKGINLFCYGDESELGLDRQIELMLENGFSRTFVMADHPMLSDTLVDKVKRASISFDTLHAPFYGINSIWKTGEEGERMLKTLCDSVDKCADYEIPVAIIHLSSGRPAPKISDAGNLRFEKLVEYAEKKNVTLAFENQRFVANLASVMEQHSSVGFCWDIGHEGCFTKGIKFMNLFGSRLSAVHLHDNHHLADEDEHLIPFDGITDFESVAKQLVWSGFCGTIMLEVFRSESDRYKTISPEEYYRRAGKAAEAIVELVEKERSRI